VNSAVDTSIVTTAPTKPLRAEELDLLDRYSRGELLVRLVRRSDLLARHPLLREPLLAEHVKPGLLAYWGTAPGLHLLYAHMNRVIKDRDLDALDITAGSRRRRPRGQCLPGRH
jgi:xylulose-5-phosphate/fructose-6-phosphate phosphoketolase